MSVLVCSSYSVSTLPDRSPEAATIVYVARESILAGSELTFFYGSEHPVMKDCRCGTAFCASKAEHNISCYGDVEVNLLRRFEQFQLRALARERTRQLRWLQQHALSDRASLIEEWNNDVRAD